MNKIYYQQVAKCTDDGKLEINNKSNYSVKNVDKADIEIIDEEKLN